MQLFKLQAEDDPIVNEWLKKRSNKYTSHKIQNELLKIMAPNVLRKVSACLHSSSFYSIMADETTDIYNREQVTIILRWVDDTDFSVNEEFVDLYAVPSIGSDMLVSIIKDNLIRLNLSLSKARGQYYDGASNMSGIRNGIAAQLCKEEARAVYTHCYGYSLNLAAADAVKRSALMKSASMYEIT